MWKRGKNHKYTKLKGKIIINVTLIRFEGTCKTIPFNSILEFSILLDFKMRNVIIWTNLLKTLCAHDIDVTSLRRIDVSTTSCACWEFAPPPLLPPPSPQYFKPCTPPPQFSKPSYAYVKNFKYKSLYIAVQPSYFAIKYLVQPSCFAIVCWLIRRNWITDLTKSIQVI